VTRAAGGLAVEVVFPPVPAGGGCRAEDQARAEERAGTRERAAAPA